VLNVSEGGVLVQARVVQEFVGRILAADPSAPVVVLGDFNDFQFSEAMTTLAHDLTNLTDILPSSERYTYNFEGNSQALDHVLVSPALATGAQCDVVHTSAEFADGLSDHDPVRARRRSHRVVGADVPWAPVAAQSVPNDDAHPLRYQPLRPVEIAVYDVVGRRVRALKTTRIARSAGRHMGRPSTTVGNPRFGVYLLVSRAASQNDPCR
jgi:hypothetical protein